MTDRHPAVPWDLRAMEKACNPDISIKVGEGSSCKFHLRPLDEVIKHEREAGLIDPVPDNFWDGASK